MDEAVVCESWGALLHRPDGTAVDAASLAAGGGRREGPRHTRGQPEWASKLRLLACWVFQAVSVRLGRMWGAGEVPRPMGT